MDPRQELREIEGLASELNERARKLRQQLNGDPVVEGKTLGHRVRLLRARKGWTQERLAEESGLSVNAIIKIESDKTTRPRVNTIRQLTQALGVDEYELEW